MPLSSSVYGSRTFFLALALFSLVTTAIMGRQLAINHNRYFVMMVISSVVLTVGMARRKNRSIVCVKSHPEKSEGKAEQRMRCSA
jgi:hypothetical protein